MAFVFGIDRHVIYRSVDARPDGRLRSFPDRLAARQFLGGFMRDPIDMARLRQLLLGCSIGAPLSSSDQDVVDGLAWQLSSGQLAVVTVGRHLAPLTKPSVRPEPPPPRPQQKAPAPAPPPPREAPVPADPGLVAQAKTLVQAAENGTPFCEECARLRAEKAQEAVF